MGHKKKIAKPKEKFGYQKKKQTNPKGAKRQRGIILFYLKKTKLEN